MLVEVRNQFRRNDKIEIVSARDPDRTDNILKIVDQDQQEMDVVNPGNQVEITLASDTSPNDIIRKVTI